MNRRFHKNENENDDGDAATDADADKYPHQSNGTYDRDIDIDINPTHTAARHDISNGKEEEQNHSLISNDADNNNNDNNTSSTHPQSTSASSSDKHALQTTTTTSTSISSTKSSSTLLLSTLSPFHTSPSLPIKLLYLWVGTAIGVLCRYGILLSCNNLISPTTQYPLGTILCNIIGCIVIGCTTSMIQHFSSAHKSKTKGYLNIRLLMVVGFCGSLTTWSTYVNDTYELIHTNGWSTGLWLACINILINNICCFIAVILGFMSGKFLIYSIEMIEKHIEHQSPTTVELSECIISNAGNRDAELLNIEAQR